MERKDLYGLEEYLDKELMSHFKCLEPLGYAFESKEGSILSEIRYAYIHKENNKRCIALSCIPARDFLTVYFFNFETELKDQGFSLSDDLKAKGFSLQSKGFNQKDKNLYGFIKLFKKAFARLILEDKKLRDILSIKSPWRNLPLEYTPRTDKKELEAYIDSALIPESKAFKKAGLLYQDKESQVRKSEVTSYTSYEWTYFYKPIQSDEIELAFYISPEFFFIDEYLTLNVTLTNWNIKNPLNRTFSIADYLKFKNRSDLEDIEAQNQGDLYKTFKLSFDLIGSLLLKDELKNVLQGERGKIPSKARRDYENEKALEFNGGKIELYDLEQYLDQEFISDFKIIRSLEYEFKEKSFSLTSTAFYKYLHKKDKKREIIISCTPKDYDFDAGFHNSHLSLFDSAFHLRQYLRAKKRIPSLKRSSKTEKNIYKATKDFKKLFTQSILEDKELRYILSIKSPWRNPLMMDAPRVDIKEFESYMDSFLIPEPKAFKNLDLLYDEKKQKVKKSTGTNYMQYDFSYFYKHFQSDVKLKLFFSPDFFSIYESIAFVATVFNKASGPYKNKSFSIEDYLTFKKRDELKERLRYIEEHRRGKPGKPHEEFQLFVDFISQLLLIERDLKDIIQGKCWEDIPNYLWLAHEDDFYRAQCKELFCRED